MLLRHPVSPSRFVLFLSSLLLIASPASAFALTHVCSADRDAFVDENNVLYGSPPNDQSLDVGFRNWVEGLREYRAAIRFDVPAWLSGKDVTGATLRLYYFDAWETFDVRDVNVARIAGAIGFVF